MFAGDRARAGELRERYPHTAEVLELYLALVEVWESVGDHVPPGGCVEWARAYVLPRVIDATTAHGPPLLAAAVGAAARKGLLAPAPRYDLLEPVPRDDLLDPAAAPDSGDGPLAGAGSGLLAAWLADEDLTPVERYLARATMRVVPRQALRPMRPVHEPPPTGPAGREAVREEGTGGVFARCRVCGGPPQVSYRAAADDPLVSGRRMLECAKCGNAWAFSATTCPGCGEPAKRTVYAEPRPGPQVGRAAAAAGALFPHLRADACRNCRRYLIDVDLGRDPKAVPRVDELAAVPIDLHMTDQGYTKITPNLMGF